MVPNGTSSFQRKKQKIVDALSVPIDEYTDFSPKGSVDIQIRDLIDEINAIAGLVTTSSCAGRVSIFVEGPKRSRKVIESSDKAVNEDDVDGEAGDRWLYINHERLDFEAGNKRGWRDMFGLSHNTSAHSSKECPNGNKTTQKLIHFKFEPMILHIQAASLSDANAVLIAANQAGFRESGAMNLNPDENGIVSPMVGVRSMGLGFDSIIGHQGEDGAISSLVDETHLGVLVKISNERFDANAERIERFRENMRKRFAPVKSSPKEDYETRRQRKKAEGLARQLQSRKDATSTDDVEVEGLVSGYDLEMHVSATLD